MINRDAVDLPKLAEMLAPFEENEISKLPKGKGVFLDYVGHAALTKRLLEVDPCWSWEPMALTPEGLPLFDQGGGLWIRLTVCGMTRLGYGDANKEGGDAIKEVIGDALRNAAMRFGAALALWHKGDLYANSRRAPQFEQEPEGDYHPTAEANQAAHRHAAELLALYPLASDEPTVQRLDAQVKTEWHTIRVVKGISEKIKAAREAAYARVRAPNPENEGR